MGILGDADEALGAVSKMVQKCRWVYIYMRAHDSPNAVAHYNARARAVH